MTNFSLRRLAAPALAAALVASPAAAQRLVFDAKSYAAAPGEAVTLKLLVSDCGDPVSGVRFTLRVRAEDTGALMLDKATSFPGESFRAFGCAQNVVPSREASEGFLKGNVAELRGALYSLDINVPRVLAREEKHAASVVLPVGFGAAGRYVVELAADPDEKGDSLAGIYNTRGAAMTPPDRTAPLTSIASIVVHDGSADMVTRFAGGSADGWLFDSPPAAGIDSVAAGVATADGGLEITADGEAAMGSWRFDVDRLGAWRLQPARTIYVATAEARSTPGAWMSVRTGETETVVLGNEGEEAEPVTLMAEALGEGRELDLRFSLLAGGANGAPRRAALASLTERMVSVDLLGKKRTDYLRVFSAGQDGKWKPAEGDAFELQPVRHANDTSGIGIEIGGEQGEFRTGTWTTPAGVSGVVASAARWYRVEADVVVPEGAAAPAAARLRVHTSNHSWTAMAAARPAGPGAQKTVFWFAPPAAADGADLYLSFDVLGTAAGEGEPKPTAYLKQARVESWDAP